MIKPSGAKCGIALLSNLGDSLPRKCSSSLFEKLMLKVKLDMESGMSLGPFKGCFGPNFLGPNP